MSKKFTDLVQLTTPETTDILPIDDVSASTTKKITVTSLLNTPDTITGGALVSYKTSRSNNGSTVVESAAKIVTGWTAVVVVTANATQATAITFPTSSFTGFPIVNCAFAGDQVSGAVSATGTGVNAVVGAAGVKIHSISSTGFTAFASAISGTWSVGNVLYFHWTAIGN